MRRYILKRVMTGLLAIIVVLILNFIIIHAAPGDPIRIMAGMDNPSEQAIATLRAKYGLDQPLTTQFIRYVGNLLQGDFGDSLTFRQPVLTLVLAYMGPSLLLALTACLLSVCIGTLLGLLAGRKRGTWLDAALSYVSYLFDAMPPFWLGLISILIFASTFHWLPTSGMYNLRAGYTGIAKVWDLLVHLILPVSVLTLVQVPAYLRITRTSVLQVMDEDFVTTFRATGMPEKMIFRRYVLKNAMLPTVTLFGISLAYVVAGAALVEIVHAWPGIGQLMLNAINRRDYPLLMGLYLILSVSVTLTMLFIDLLYAWLDPRIRISR